MLDLTVLKKIYVADKDDAAEAVLTVYERQGYAVVNYLYFAQLMHQRLIEGTPAQIQKSYLDALCSSDFLFADGIALQLFSRWTIGRLPPNLNGTDFCPLMLHTIIQRFGVEHIHLGLLNVRDEKIGKNEQYIEKIVSYIEEVYGVKVAFGRQCHYRDRATANPRHEYEHSLLKESSKIPLLLNFIGAPYQEVITSLGKNTIQQQHVLVLNQGGTLDFWMGVEKRAPRRIIQARVLETPWRILSNPAKNLRKFWWMFGVLRILPGLIRGSVVQVLERSKTSGAV